MKSQRVEMIAAGPATQQALGRLTIRTPGPGFTEITRQVASWLAATAIRNGVLTAFCRHTSASLTIQENADPDVRTDLITALERLAPRKAGYVHDIEGPDDMPAHIRTMLTDASLSIPTSKAVSRSAHGRGCTSSSTAIAHMSARSCCM